jgi:acyl-coenzyme A synthetase/AMP-(fatty) acid ligase
MVAPIPVQNEMSETDVAARLEQANAKLFITDSDLLVLSEVASELAGVIPVGAQQVQVQVRRTRVQMVTGTQHTAYTNHTTTGQDG